MSKKGISNGASEEGAEPSSSSTSGPARIRELLARYDELIEREVAELVSVYRQLTPVEAALLESDELAIAPLARFRREHRRQTRTPFRQYAGLLATLAISFAAIVWSLASIS